MCHGLRLTFIILSMLAFGCATADENRKKMDPSEKALLWVQAAHSSLQGGDTTGALQALASAEKEDSDVPEIYLERALVFYKRHDLNRALENAQKAIHLRKNFAEAETTYGHLLMEAGRSAEAIIPLNAAASDTLYREAYKADTNLGIIYYRQGKFKEAETHFELAITQEPNLACVAYYYRGHLRLRESKFKEAIQDYDVATRKFCSNFTDAYLAIGIAFLDNHQYDLARKKFLEIQEHFPNTPVAEQAMKQLRSLP